VTVQWVYDGVLRDLVGIAKIEGRAAAVAACAALLPPFDPLPGAVVVPVPPSPGRRPGPHLATALAAAVARRYHLPLRRWLRQVRPAAEQHRLNRADRIRNVEGLFRARPLTAPVVLVDDLITSGATVIMAAAALKAAGAPQVQVVALGRTV
jgi:predicted amidophosphoribosyltransferase